MQLYAAFWLLRNIEFIGIVLIRLIITSSFFNFNLLISPA